MVPIRNSLCTFAAAIAMFTAVAEAQDRASNGQDSSEAMRHLAAARQAGGDDWVQAVDFLCGRNPDPGNRRESPVLDPTWMFDDFAVLGHAGTVVYVLNTSDGVILIDSGYPGEEESILLAGLAQLGLDPEDVRYVIVSHGHADHFGGARFMQERYGARVALSAADWDLMEQRRGNNPIPTRDVVLAEGQPVVLGDKAVTPVHIPGHTPGALGLIFPVNDGGNRHMVGLFGGIISGIGDISDEVLDQYVRSVGHFAEVSEDMAVDVEIHNHPIFDGMYGRLEQLAARRAGTPNPFVVGASAYQGLLDVMTECIAVQRARRAAAN